VAWPWLGQRQPRAPIYNAWRPSNLGYFGGMTAKNPFPTCICCRKAHKAVGHYCLPCQMAFLKKKYGDNPLRFRRAVSKYAANAKTRGFLRPGPCEMCGAEPAQMHHEDYDKPLEVRWLCALHHRQQHPHPRGVWRAREEVKAKLIRQLKAASRFRGRKTQAWKTTWVFRNTYFFLASVSASGGGGSSGCTHPPG